VWGIFTHYNTGDGHPMVGHSVPNFELEDGTTIGNLMQGGLAILLDFDRNASLKALASEYGDQMNYVSGRAKEQLGLSAVLIRPDGIIAWATAGDPDRNELQKATDRWFVRNSGCNSEFLPKEQCLLKTFSKPCGEILRIGLLLTYRLFSLPDS
jgi:hypothetical protein